MAPDFVVEIASKSQFRPGMQRSLAAGSLLAWLVWPKGREVEVWQPGDQEEPSAIQRVGDTLDGDAALPGFHLTVAEVFARV